MALALGSLGCESEEAKKRKQQRAPWVHTSEQAPYELTLSPGWQHEDPAILNEFADLAAAHEKNLFFIVIPQQLPNAPEEVDAPDALDLKRAGMMLMESQIEGLEIQKQGPVRVDGRTGQTVVTKGRHGDQQIKYVTTYLAEGRWGFQLVGWAPIERQHELLVEVDALLAGWKFAEPDAGAPDAGMEFNFDMGPEPSHEEGVVGD